MAAPALPALPLELREMIASEIDTDRDFLSYMLTCRATYEAVTHTKSSAWHPRYTRRYECPPGLRSLELQNRYKQLAVWGIRLKNAAPARPDPTGRTRYVKRPNVYNLALLVSDAYKGLAAGEQSKNLAIVERLMNTVQWRDTILNEDKKDELNPCEISLLRTVQAATFSISSKFMKLAPFRLFQSYAYSRLDDLPLIQKDGSLNLGVTLGILGFFRQYIQDRQSPMRRLYDQLPVAKKPKKWIETLENATNPIGQKWIGISSQLHNGADVKAVQDYYFNQSRTDSAKDFALDMLDSIQEFTTMELNFDEDIQPDWPGKWEAHLRSFPPQKMRAEIVAAKAASAAARAADTARSSSSSSTGNSPGASTASATITPPSSTGSSPPGAKLQFQRPKLGRPQPGKDYLPFIGSSPDLDREPGQGDLLAGNLHPLPSQPNGVALPENTSAIAGFQRISWIQFDKTSVGLSDRFRTNTEYLKTFLRHGCRNSSTPPDESSPGHSRTRYTPEFLPASAIGINPTQDSENENKYKAKNRMGLQLDLARIPLYQGDLNAVESDVQCYAHEGVVLPGGKMIVGRWWAIVPLSPVAPSPTSATSGSDRTPIKAYKGKGKSRAVQQSPVNRAEEEKKDGDADADDYDDGSFKPSDTATWARFKRLEHSGPFVYWCIDPKKKNKKKKDRS